MLQVGAEGSLLQPHGCDEHSDIQAGRHGPSKHRAAYFLSQETEPTFASLEKQPVIGFNNIHVPFSRHPFVCRALEGSAFVWISHVSTIYKTQNPAK
jgi:hypothetical protein